MVVPTLQIMRAKATTPSCCRTDDVSVYGQRRIASGTQKKNNIYIYIKPNYGCKNNVYNLVVQTINSEHSTTVIPTLLRKPGSLWHNHYTWCTNATMYERRVVVVRPLHRV
jgi:hypothetical protein